MGGFELLCFFRAFHSGHMFLTKCPDWLLTVRRQEPPGDRGVLFLLSLKLIGLIRSASVAAISEGTESDPAGFELLPQFMEELDWTLPEPMNKDFV